MAVGDASKENGAGAISGGRKRNLNQPQGSMLGGEFLLLLFIFALVAEQVGGSGTFNRMENLQQGKPCITAFSPPLFFAHRKPDVCSQSSLESSVRVVLEGAGWRRAPKVACNARAEALGKIIDGKSMAQEVRNEVKGIANVLAEKYGKPPGLAVVIVGNRTDSQVYVRNKVKACEECGIHSLKVELPAETSEHDIIQKVRSLNADPAIHGVLVQLPLPPHVNEATVLDEVSLAKDVDGFHPLNIGLLALKGRAPSALPCTPAAVMEMLRRSCVPLRGKRAVVLGRSNIVGMPVALLLLAQDASVQILHSHTPHEDLEQAVRAADILVACAGSPGLVKGEWVKEGSVVIDVAINAIDDPSKKKGYRLAGDVEFATAVERAGRISPVPGGVGPMTIAMLMRNTVTLAEKQLSGA